MDSQCNPAAPAGSRCLQFPCNPVGRRTSDSKVLCGLCGRHAGIYQILQGGHGFIFRVWPSLVPAAFPGRGHPVQGAFDDQAAFEVGVRDPGYCPGNHNSRIPDPDARRILIPVTPGSTVACFGFHPCRVIQNVTFRPYSDSRIPTLGHFLDDLSAAGLHTLSHNPVDIRSRLEKYLHLVAIRIGPQSRADALIFSLLIFFPKCGRP